MEKSENNNITGTINSNPNNYFSNNFNVENYLPKDYHETIGRKYDVGNLQAALSSIE